MPETPRARPHLYPALLELENRDVLLVGGGEVAFRKAMGLFGSACRLTVVASELLPSFKAWLDEKRILYEERPYRNGEAAGYFLVLSATDDAEVNRRIAEDAQGAGRLINVADQPALSSFFVPSVVKRDALQVAISTDGKCPALALKIRLELEEVLSDRYGPLLERLATMRDRLRAAFPASGEQRKRILERILSSAAVERFLSGDASRLDRMLSGWEKSRVRSRRPDGGQASSPAAL
ncbi:MAG: bifunctional precorrin-2 dehydrogenase/sirohydrochlorin ferrochelatase [bacterium]